MRTNKLHFLLSLFIILAGVLSFLPACQELKETPFIDLKAGFLPSSDLVKIGETVTFNQTSTVVARSFQWDFGDGIGSSAEPAPTYTYDAPGVYNVRMVAGKSDGISTDTLTRRLVVIPETEIPANFLTEGEAASDEFGYCFSQNSFGDMVIAGRQNINNLFVSYYNSDGTLSWRREFPNLTSGTIFPRDITFLNDGSIVLVGYFIYGGLSGSTEHDSFVLKLDDGGSEEWRVVNATSRDEFYHSVVELNNRILVGGSVAEAGGAQSEILVDTYGNSNANAGILLSTFSTGKSWSAREMRFTQDGGLIVAANLGTRPMLLRYSSNLQLLARQNLPFTGTAEGVRQLNNGDIVMVGSIYEEETPDSTNAFVSYFNSFNQEQWRDTLVFFQEELYSIAQTGQGEFVVVGKHYNPITKEDVVIAKYQATNSSPTAYRLLGGIGNDTAYQVRLRLPLGDAKIRLFGYTENQSDGTLNARKDLLFMDLNTSDLQ